MKFRLDQKGIASLRRTPEMHVYVAATAHLVAETVPAMAPRRSGHYDAGVESALLGYSSARARVYARDFKSHWIEHGAGPSPMRGGRPFRARHPLRNAVLACGLRYVDNRLEE